MITITGGTTTIINGNNVCEFLTNGTIQFKYNCSAQVLIVGGGGGGGAGRYNYEGAGGGGGGGVGYGTLNFIAGVTYNITVGLGGTGDPGSVTGSVNIGTSGGNTSVVGGSINAIAYGGGRGGSTTGAHDATSGGSGGGGSGWGNTPGTAKTGIGGGLTYIGNSGGFGLGAGSGGGGGGASQAGTIGTSGQGGTTAKGGNGYIFPNNNISYGDGGGPGLSGNYGGYNGAPTQYGGNGGNGNGGRGGGTLAATNGVNNTGGGGGGGFGGTSNFATPTRRGGNGGSGYVYISFEIIQIPCFKENSKILTSTGYVPIEKLREGDLIRTLNHGYKPIYMISKREINHKATNDRIKEQLYKCSSSEYPEIFEPLVLTGCHSILVDKFKDETQRQKVIDVNGDAYVTDNKYRLPACVDTRSSVYETPGLYTVYHLALENIDYYTNYGIYANGLLVESCSKRYLSELSNMERIGGEGGSPPWGV
jgi:hypothetical protein